MFEQVPKGVGVYIGSDGSAVINVSQLCVHVFVHSKYAFVFTDTSCVFVLQTPGMSRPFQLTQSTNTNVGDPIGTQGSTAT